jgi:release factor glutamine methyltransferase
VSNAVSDGRATIDGIVRAAAARLESALGAGAGRREARALWAAVAGVTPGDAWLHGDRAPSDELAARFQDAVRRREGGEPFAYAAGGASFRMIDLRLDRRALIPRPETEGLVDLALRWSERAGWGPGGAAADLGTGSGCIALSLAGEGTFERIVAVEHAPAAAALARENITRVRPPVPVEVREGDWLVPLAGERFRIIVANPPYLTAKEYAALDPAVRGFEPLDALVSGSDGLDATRRILAGAAPLLEPGGALVLEIDERRAGAVQSLATEYAWERALIHDDLFGRPRYALVLPREDA